MQKGFLNSPTDGNGTAKVNTKPDKGINITPVTQSLSGPDTAVNTYTGGMPRNAPGKNCGCGNNKPPMQQAPIPQRQLPPAPQQTTINQAKNYYNKVAAKYPQQNQ